MFETKIGVSLYMSRFGLFAMRGPNENVLQVGPRTSITERRLASTAAIDAAGAPGPSSNSNSKRNVSDVFLHPIRDGRRSGFACSVFPRKPLAFKSPSHRNT